ncbi:GPO family capsid scaffolding protein [Gilliamella sp. B2717]|uniref:GPO family capsid scaffolding protein n=1 Tax=Gilliamella sp. B2717 TaxID=2817996 RepID=UPI00226A9858|nr:GPO family capsid scaffolding protein [Gilliamella sp. B2717]MCX8578448.1 GPO family capsid scaffolding protein [Gilliamella sp. B2717]
MAEIKISDWLCIAQEGKTIDGREIKREWLESVVKNYSAELYQALVWCEHEDPFWRQFSANLGTVEELKLEEKKGKLRLMARLRANAILQSMNEQEQKIYSSIEILPDFPEDGDFYLVGLAATDQPASTGTSRLAFSANKQGFRAEPVLLFNSEKNNCLQSKKINLSKLTKRENFSMTQDEIDALLAELEEAKSAIAELQEQNKTLIEQLENGNAEAAQATAEEIQGKAEQAIDNIEDAKEATEAAADNAEFSRIKKEMAQLKAEHNALTDKFNALMKTPVSQKPGISSQTFSIDLH